MHTRTWNVTVNLYEHEDSTRAEAVLVGIDRRDSGLRERGHDFTPRFMLHRALRRRTAKSPANCTRQTMAISTAITTAITVVSNRW